MPENAKKGDGPKSSAVACRPRVLQWSEAAAAGLDLYIIRRVKNRKGGESVGWEGSAAGT